MRTFARFVRIRRGDSDLSTGVALEREGTHLFFDLLLGLALLAALPGELPHVGCSSHIAASLSNVRKDARERGGDSLNLHGPHPLNNVIRLRRDARLSLQCDVGQDCKHHDAVQYQEEIAYPHVSLRC